MSLLLWFDFGCARSGFSPVVAGRVTLRLLCRGCSLRRLSCSGAAALGHTGFPGCSTGAQRRDAQAHGPVQQASSKKAQVRRPSCRDDMDLQKHQTTWSHQLARSSLPTRASLLAVPISDSSWSSRGCSLDLGGEPPPPFPTVMGAEATALSALDFFHYHDVIFECSGFLYRSWIMEVENVLVSSPGIELVGLF